MSATGYPKPVVLVGALVNGVDALEIERTIRKQYEQFVIIRLGCEVAPELRASMDDLLHVDIATATGHHVQVLFPGDEIFASIQEAISANA